MTRRTSWSSASGGATVVGSHELQIYLASRGVEAIGMNTGGTVEAAGIKLTMVHAVHTGGVTITGDGPDVTREVGCWGWLIEFEDGTRVYHSGDTDLFGDMALVREWRPSIGVFPIGGHYTMGPAGRGSGGRADRCAGRHTRPLRNIPDPGRHAGRARGSYDRAGHRAGAG